MNKTDVLPVVEWAVAHNWKFGLKLPMDRPWIEVTDILARLPGGLPSHTSDCMCKRSKVTVRSNPTVEPNTTIYLGQCPACEKIFFGWKWS